MLTSSPLESYNHTLIFFTMGLIHTPHLNDVKKNAELISYQESKCCACYHFLELNPSKLSGTSVTLEPQQNVNNAVRKSWLQTRLIKKVTQFSPEILDFAKKKNFGVWWYRVSSTQLFESFKYYKLSHAM